MIKSLMKYEKMSEEDAIEFIDFNSSFHIQGKEPIICYDDFI